MALLHIYAHVSPKEWTQPVVEELKARLASQIGADVHMIAGGINIFVPVTSRESSQQAADLVHDAAAAVELEISSRHGGADPTRLRIDLRY